MTHQNPPYSLRMSYELRQRLQEQAQRNDRSLHREIMRRLEQSLEKENAPGAATSEALVRKSPIAKLRKPQ